MTIQYYVGGKIVGLSSDVKPTSVPTNTTFIESDTFSEFIFDGVVTWNPIVSAPPPPIDDTDLKAYWKFNEASSPVLNQSQAAASLGTAADIAMTGGTFGVPGIIGDALEFNGSSDFGVCDNSTSLFNFLHNASAHFTILAWIKFPAITSDASACLDDSDLGLNTGFTFRVREATGVTMQIFLNTPAPVINNEPAIIPDTAFNFYAITYDASIVTDACLFSVNNGTPFATNRLSVPASPNASFRMTVGRRAGSGSFFMEGTMNEFSIWDRILTDDEITELYNNGAGRAIY